MLLHRSRLFFEDLPAVHRRRESGDHAEVLSEETRGKRPRYYLRNFHFQSGGWMTDESAQGVRPVHYMPNTLLLRKHLGNELGTIANVQLGIDSPAM